MTVQLNLPWNAQLTWASDSRAEACLNLWQEPHDGAGSCKAQAGEQVGALACREQRRQVLLCAGGRPDQRPRTFIYLQLISSLSSWEFHPQPSVHGTLAI